MTTLAEFPAPPQVPEPVVSSSDSSNNSPEQIAWQRACALAADKLSATAEPTRLAKGLALAQNHRVVRTLSDDLQDFAQVQSGRTTYTITQEGQCPCTDFEKHKSNCKHLLALTITQMAGAFVEHELEVMTHASSSQPVPLVPYAGATLRVDNPAGANFKARIGADELWFTWHDTSDEALVARLKKEMPTIQALIFECQERQKAQQAQKEAPKAPLTVDSHLATLVAKAVQDALQGAGLPPSRSNGMKPAAKPDSNDVNPEWCSVHREEMTYHPADARGSAWYSHRLGSGGYCRGGN